MFCKKCGSKLSDNAKFCNICGKLITLSQVPPPQANRKPAPAKKSSNTKRTTIIGATALVFLCVGFVILGGLGFAGYRYLSEKGDGQSAPEYTTLGDMSVFTYDEADYQAQGKKIEISEDDPTASAYGVQVDFGQFNIDGKETLEIKELPEKIDVANEVKVTAYDFTLGDKVVFEDVITIYIPYDSDYVEAGAEGEYVGAKYYNESTGEWEGVFYEVDAKEKQVIVYTTHLSLYGLFQVKNENSRRAYITNAYALGSFVDGNKSFQVLQELAENGEPGEAAFEAGLLAVKNLFGGMESVVTSVTLGGQYDTALANNLGGGFRHTGLALSAVQTTYDFIYNFSDDRSKLETFANLSKNLAGNVVNYFGSSALQVGFASVYVFDMLLSTVQSDMMELKLENIGEVYTYYNDVEAPRTNKEWRRLFIKIMQENQDDPEKARQLIEKEIDDFCERFWTLDYGKIKEIAGVSGKKYNFDARDYTNDKEVLTAQFKAHMLVRLQPALTSARNYLLNQALESAQKKLETELFSLQKQLNTVITVKIIELPEEEGNFQYIGYTVRFALLSDTADKNSWTGKMPASGEINTSFTILGHMQSGLPDTVELYAPGDDVPMLTVPFEVTSPNIFIILKSSGEDETESSEKSEIKSISFSGGTQHSLVTYGLYAALNQAGRINFDSSGKFYVSVPFSTTTAPTKNPPPFSVEVSDMQTQGTWNEKDGSGTFTLSCTVTSKRVERSDLEDPMGNDEWYYLTTYSYSDAVTASGTITREADKLVLTMDVVANRTGDSRLASVIVNDGESKTGDNPIITNRSGSFSETAVYNFIINE